MKITQEYRVGIITSLIASIVFLIFLEPIVRLLGKVFLYCAASFSSAYVDRLYAKAALGAPADPSLYLFCLMCLVLGFFVVTMGIAAFVKGNSDSDEPTTDKAKKNSRSSGKFKAISLLLAIVIGIYFQHMYWATWFQIRLVTSFNQHIDVIAPFIEPQKEKLLKSQWGQMKSQADYKEIYSELSRIAEANHIKLPPNPVYRLDDY